MQALCLLGFLLVGGTSLFPQDFQVTELSVPHNGETLLKTFANDNELLMVFKKDAGKARILHRKLDPPSEWKEVDVTPVVGKFYLEIPAGSGKSTIPSAFIANPDAFYFETFGEVNSCGGSYRIKDGKLEVIAGVGQDINLQTYEGVNLKTQVRCAFVANPFGTTGDPIFRLWTRTLSGQANDGFVRKMKNGSFITLLSASTSELPAQYPYPYALSQNHSELGVWGDESNLFFMETDRVTSTRAAQFDLKNRKLTRLYDFGTLTLNYNISPSTGKRQIVIAQASGGWASFNFPEEKGKLEAMFTTPRTIADFGRVIAVPRGPISKEMMLFGVIPEEARPMAYKAVAFWNGKDTVIALKEGQVLPSGNTVKNLNIMYTSITEAWTSSKCRAFIPLFQSGGLGKLDTLVQVQTPCITEHPSAQEEGFPVLLKGANFTIGSNKVEVELPGIGYTPAYDITPNQLTFTAAFGCNPCDIRVVSGTFKSNVVRINFTSQPVPEPKVAKLTDLYVAEGPGAPGKIMVLWGEEFCSFHSQTPLSVANKTVDGLLPIDVPSGCRVLVDGREAGLYFGWTGNTGFSQINFVLPYDLAKGRHELRVQKVDTRNGNRFVVATSRPFPFEVEELNPTFFTTFEKEIVLQKGQGYIGSSSPAFAGDILSVYLSGGGGTSPLRTDRTAGVAPFLKPVRIWINDIESEVLYAGSQPESPGLEQINFRISPDVVPENGLGRLKIQIGENVQTFLFNLDKL